MTTEAKYAGLTAEELERALYTDPDATELERELAAELADAEAIHREEADLFKEEIAALEAEVERLNHELELADAEAIHREEADLFKEEIAALEAEVERLNHELERAA